MTTCCEHIPNDCDSLQVVAYSILTVDPNLDTDDPDDRLLAGPYTVVLSGALTDADIPAFAIASAYRHPSEKEKQTPEEVKQSERLRKANPEYLRVCFQVQCRYIVPCLDYDKQQAKALRSIGATLALAEAKMKKT